MSRVEIERYADAIQTRFGQKRGASLILSCNDFLKIEEWFEKGVPFRAVIKGIDAYFEKIDPSRRRRAIVLRFAEGNILDEWEFMKSGGVSESGRRQTPEEEAAERKERLDVFYHRCRRAHKGAELWAARLFAELADRACQAIQTRCGAHTVGTLKPLSELAESFEDHIIAYLRENATPIRLESPRRTAERDLAPFKPRMDEKTYREVLETNTFRCLASELGVPNLLEEM